MFQKVIKTKVLKNLNRSWKSMFFLCVLKFHSMYDPLEIRYFMTFIKVLWHWNIQSFTWKLNLLPVLLFHNIDCILYLGTPFVQDLLCGAEEEALGGFEALGSASEAPGVRVPLEAVLHPPDDGVHPLGRGLHRRLEVEGGEGDVLHGEVWLQGVGDVLVTCRDRSIGINF